MRMLGTGTLVPGFLTFPINTHYFGNLDDILFGISRLSHNVSPLTKTNKDP